MRKLTMAQKKQLRLSIEKYRKINGGKFPNDVWDLPECNKIDALNPCELWYQNANGFIFDTQWNIIR